MKARISAIVVSFALVACATPAPPISISDIERSAVVSVRDLRPAYEKEAKYFSLLVTSDAYGTSRVGDDPVKPPPLRVLQHRAFEKFGSGLASSSISVHHFVIYMNLQSLGRRTAFGAAVGGAIGAAISGGTASQRSPGGSSLVTPQTITAVGDDEWRLALFSPEENPGPVVSYIVYIDTEIRGARRVTKTIFPSQQDNINLAIPVAVEQAIAFHLAQ